MATMTPEQRRKKILEEQGVPQPSLIGAALTAPYTVAQAARAIPAVAETAIGINRATANPPTNPVGRMVYDAVTSGVGPRPQSGPAPAAPQPQAPATTSRVDQKTLLRQLQQQQEADMIALRRPGADVYTLQDGLRARGQQIAALANEVGPRAVSMSPEEKAAMIRRGTEQSALATEQARRQEAATPSRAEYAGKVQAEYDKAATQRGLGLEGQPNRFARLESLSGAGTAGRMEGIRGGIEEGQLGLARSMGGQPGSRSPIPSDEAIAARLKQLSDEEKAASAARRMNPDVAGSRATQDIEDVAVRGRLAQEATTKATEDRQYASQLRQAERGAELANVAAGGVAGLAAREQIAQAEVAAGMQRRERDLMGAGYPTMAEYNTQADAVLNAIGSLSGYSNPLGLGVFQDESAIKARVEAFLGRLGETPPESRARLAKELLTKIELEQVDALESEDPIVVDFLNRLRSLAQTQ